MTKQHGGKREGAGRKYKYGCKCKLVPIPIDILDDIMAILKTREEQAKSGNFDQFDLKNDLTLKN